MPVDIYDKEFQNWLKGVLGLNTTREVLCVTIYNGFRHFISKLPQPEKSHIQQFLCCLEDKKLPPLNQPKHLKQPEQKRKKMSSYYGCSHEKCKTLFEKFLEQHTEKGKLDLKWDVLDQHVETNRSEPITENEVDMLWEISKLYMYANDVTKYQGLDDLDISNVIKIMRSCALFYPDGSRELYEEVLGFRNELMHSPNNKVSEDYLKKKLGKAIELIQLLSTDHNQTEASLYLQEISENDFQISFQSEEYKWVLAEVVKAESIAVKLQTDERNRTDLTTLQEILKRITDSGPTDISKQLVRKASEFKELVKNCIEKKKKSIEFDKAVCSQEDSAKFESLEQKIDQDLTEINQQLKKTDEEELADLIDNLSKENKTLKTERKDAVRVKDNLVKENKNLREENKKREHEASQYFEELERYRKGQDRIKASHDTPQIQTVNDAVDSFIRRKQVRKEKTKVERYRASLNDSVGFYMKKIHMKPEDLKIDKLHVEWWDEYQILEEHTEYIYWLFPVKALNLNEHDEKQQLQKIKEFQRHKTAMKRLLTSYKMMLNFYGLMLENETDGTIQRAENWKERFEHLKKSTKNKLRIERIMECLEQFGYEHLMENFMRFVHTEGILEETLPT